MRVRHDSHAAPRLAADCRRQHLETVVNPPAAWPPAPAKVIPMLRILAHLRRLRRQALARHELDMLSDRQLRDLDLERVMALDSPVYRRRVWNAV